MKNFLCLVSMMMNTHFLFFLQVCENLHLELILFYYRITLLNCNIGIYITYSFALVKRS